MKMIAIVLLMSSFGWSQATKPGNPPPPFIPTTTFTLRTEQAIKDGFVMKSESKAILKNARQCDQRIAQYLQAKPIPEPHAQAMYAGNVEVGMTIDQVELYSHVTRDSEVGDTKYVTMLPWNPRPQERVVYFELTVDAAGVITAVNRPRGE